MQLTTSGDSLSLESKGEPTHPTVQIRSVPASALPPIGAIGHSDANGTLSLSPKLPVSELMQDSALQPLTADAQVAVSALNPAAATAAAAVVHHTSLRRKSVNVLLPELNFDPGRSKLIAGNNVRLASNGGPLTDASAPTLAMAVKIAEEAVVEANIAAVPELSMPAPFASQQHTNEQPINSAALPLLSSETLQSQFLPAASAALDCEERAASITMPDSHIDDAAGMSTDLRHARDVTTEQSLQAASATQSMKAYSGTAVPLHPGVHPVVIPAADVVAPPALSVSSAKSDHLAALRAKQSSAEDTIASSASNFVDKGDQDAGGESNASDDENVAPVPNGHAISLPNYGLQHDGAYRDTSDESNLRRVSHPSVSANATSFPSKSAKIHVPMRHARVAMLSTSTSASDAALRNTFWTLLTGETPSAALVHACRCIIEPELSGMTNVWVRSADADPLCYLSLIFSRANAPPITFFSVINASPQSQVIDSLYLRDVGIFIVPFNLDPFLANAAHDHDSFDASAAILNSLVSLFQRIAVLCVHHAANGDFTGPAVLLVGVCSTNLSASYISILNLVSVTFFDVLKGSFVSSGLVECMLDASTCLWFYPVSLSSSYGLSAVQDALCAFFYGPANKTFTVPQHWFHLMTSIRQNSQPVVPMSLIQSLAAECFALDIPSQQVLPELERFISFFTEQGIACRSPTEPELFLIDSPVLAWQLAAAVLYHDGSTNHPSQSLQSSSRRSHQQAYHSFLSTGHLTLALLKTFASSDALARHAQPILIASGLLFPLSAANSAHPPQSFAVLPMMPKVSSKSLQPASSSTPCLSLICFISTCDVAAGLLSSLSLSPSLVFTHRVRPLWIIPQLWAELKAMVLDEMRLDSESIVMSSAVFACIAGDAFSVEHDLLNQVFRVRLHGIARDMLLSRVSGCFSRVLVTFPFVTHKFALESSQIASCASLTPVLFALRGLLDCAAAGSAFHCNEAVIASQEIVSVLGNSYQSAPWVNVCIVYSPASPQFARAVCDALSRAPHVSKMAVHCFMARAVPFVNPDLEFIHAVTRADHLIVLAEEQELADAVHSQPHSVFVSQLLTLYRLLMKPPGLSFSSFIFRGHATSTHNSLPDVARSSLASSLAASPVTPTAAATGVRDGITKIFLGTERVSNVSVDSGASAASFELSQARALASAVLELLASMLQPLIEDADVFQREFSAITLESDSALHMSSSIELDVSAQSRANASSNVSIPYIQSPAAAVDVNLDNCMGQSSGDGDGYNDDDEYYDDINGYDGDGDGFPPQPPTPPDDDDVLELESLMLSLAASPAAADPTADAAASEISLRAFPVSASHSESKNAGQSVLQLARVVTRQDVCDEAVGTDDGIGNRNSAPRTAKEFLKRGANHARQKQRQSTGTFKSSSPKHQETADAPPTASSISHPYKSPLPSPPSSNRPHSAPLPPLEFERSSRESARHHAPPPLNAVLTPPREPPPPDAHPRLTLLLPELCFDRSPGAAHRLVCSWLDEGRVSSSRSSAMRLVCLCEMHIARPQGPTSSPLILWHRCSHQGFHVSAAKGRV
jgi:hypothetical protein